ncbi:MAG: hypothetical protein M3308_05800 [Actinomycetota bacterium]|nr:hypothetical protein [Actinomycetota bacterium]
MTVLSPLSLIVALLVYFAQVRESAYARTLGFNPSLLEEKPISTYLIGSVEAVFFPLLVAVIGLLLWLWLDRLLRQWVRDGLHLHLIFPVSWVLLGCGATLIMISLFVNAVSPVARPYVSLTLPFLLALAVLVAAYGASLRRLAARNATREEGVSHRQAINALTGLLVSLLLFWGVDGFAQVVGRGLAERIIEQPQRSTRTVLLYSTQDLNLDLATATELPGDENSTYRYRYEGLRLVLVDGDNYFLIGQNWGPRSGTLIVLPRDEIRIEFPRGVV